MSPAVHSSFLTLHYTSGIRLKANFDNKIRVSDFLFWCCVHLESSGPVG